MKTNRILVVDDDESLRRVLQVELEQDGYSVTAAASAQEAFSLLQLRAYDLVVTDLRMPGVSGIEVLKQVKSQYPETVVIVLTAFGTVEAAVEAIKCGAYDFLTKPVHPEELSLVVARALDHLRLIEEVRALRANLNQKYGFENIRGIPTPSCKLWTLRRGRRERIPRCSFEERRGPGRNCWHEPSTSTARAKMGR